MQPTSAGQADTAPLLLATSLSTAGYVVSAITADGYLRLQSLPFPNPQPMFNALRNAQPVQVQTRDGRWINGVIAGISVHLQRGRAQVPNPNDLDNLYVDIGATSAADAAAAGVEILSPVVLDRQLYSLQNGFLTAAGIADRYGPAALVEVLRHLDPSRLDRRLIVAFVTQNDRGLSHVMQKFPDAQVTWLGGEALPRRLQTVARAQVEMNWPGTPAEMIDGHAVDAMVTRLETALHQDPAPLALPPPDRFPEPALPASPSAAPAPEQILPQLAAQYGVNPHEQRVRAAIQALLPPWAHPSVDAAGNLLLHWGDAAANAPRLLFVAHQDEIGFDVASIAPDGRLVLRSRGGGDLNFYLGHPILVHSASGMVPGVLELPPGWQQRGFTLTGSHPDLRADIGTRSAAEVAALGILPGDSVTIPKRYRQLLNGRATTRAFDDRVGDTALVAAAWALGESLPGRDVTFAWSTGEEIGLVGAGALAKQLSDAQRTPTYVFAIDTFVSSDSPLESHRFADTPIGAGFVIRAIDNSSLDPWQLARRLQ
ncbi:MAG: M28 family peptidase, partial [Terriglobales bacterium]